MNISTPPVTDNEDLNIWLQQLVKELRNISQLDTRYISVDTDATLGKEAITIKQDDDDQAFVKFDGTEAADNTKNISTGSPTGTTVKQIRVDIEGDEYWIEVKTWA